MDKTTHWLPKTLSRFADQFRPKNGCRVDRDLIGTGPQNLVKVIDTGDTAADRKGDGNRFGHSTDDVEEDMAFFMSRRNIVKNEFVGQLVRIEFPQADRVVDILQVLKLLPLHDAAVADVEAGYNSFRQHLTFPLNYGFQPW